MIITLLTDIGWEYAAEMKGVIYSINPRATIVDVSHDIMPQNIMQGAFILYSIAPYFKNSIHVGVVDPGVGTERKAIAIKCKNAWFVGPDNGLFYPAAARIGIEKVYELEIEEKASPVFHGRDVFAPAAALLSIGEKPKWKDVSVAEIKKIDFGAAVKKKGKIEARVLFIDRFGNIITNATDLFGDKFKIKIGEKEVIARMVKSYGYAEKGELVILQSSSGFMEIAMREGNAALYLGVKEGDIIEIFF
ncbi:MAG: S-adenosyl-l-methionine hydroxide adenosyltransferase family protein [Thermoplasmata archaeon]|nr:S-adenosyl-l-methionine hydroxide adenosyltransferase family protein [Thermoplasmata archaeon]